jgi:hypothetical protein
MPPAAASDVWGENKSWESDLCISRSELDDPTLMLGILGREPVRSLLNCFGDSAAGRGRLLEEEGSEM